MKIFKIQLCRNKISKSKKIPSSKDENSQTSTNFYNLEDDGAKKKKKEKYSRRSRKQTERFAAARNINEVYYARDKTLGV